jgi:NAD(P)-dependent dehydrogenase (short-subunit alcohol dehydrogenase family)
MLRLSRRLAASTHLPICELQPFEEALPSVLILWVKVCVGRWFLTLPCPSESDPSVLEKDLQDSFNVNVVGVVKTVNTFMPLIKRSSIKKVITISTGMADQDLVNKFEIDNAAPYAISKSATNMTVAKYNALYKNDGVLFLAISPGLVNTGGNLREFDASQSRWSEPVADLK